MNLCVRVCHRFCVCKTININHFLEYHNFYPGIVPTARGLSWMALFLGKGIIVTKNYFRLLRCVRVKYSKIYPKYSQFGKIFFDFQVFFPLGRILIVK